MTRLLTAIALIVAAMVLVTAPPASADGCPPGTTPQDTGSGVICVPVVDPGDPGGGSGGGGTGGGGTALCTHNGHTIPCVTDAGVWYSAHQCYAQPMTPQPAVDDPVWGGHSPEDGQMWVCASYDGPVTGGLWFFVPHGETPALIDPAELAQSALDQLELAVPEIHMAPQPPLMTYVGLETWLWMPEGHFEDLSLTVSAGGTSVTVVAAPVRATWDLTEGSTTCTSAGRPWVRGMSSDEKTDCSYTFEKVSNFEPKGEFPVSATLTYEVEWTCAGACLTPNGTLGEVDGLAGTTAIRVGERQSVVIN